ncbi:hypothetical protein CL618_02660 [archaeon]|nr:hypothetical protein [archaeon]
MVQRIILGILITIAIFFFIKIQQLKIFTLPQRIILAILFPILLILAILFGSILSIFIILLVSIIIIIIFLLYLFGKIRIQRFKFP